MRPWRANAVCESELAARGKLALTESAARDVSMLTTTIMRALGEPSDTVRAPYSSEQGESESVAATSATSRRRGIFVGR